MPKWFFFQDVLRATFISCSISRKPDCLFACCFCLRVVAGSRGDHWTTKTDLPQNSQNTQKNWKTIKNSTDLLTVLFFQTTLPVSKLLEFHSARGVMQMKCSKQIKLNYRLLVSSIIFFNTFISKQFEIDTWFWTVWILFSLKIPSVFNKFWRCKLVNFKQGNFG